VSPARSRYPARPKGRSPSSNLSSGRGKLDLLRARLLGVGPGLCDCRDNCLQV
jgi:hypothetical protein